MGHRSTQGKIVKAIPKWGCLGQWGYGHGRSVKEHGEKWFKKLSVCQDLCPQSDQCRKQHHGVMDKRYPEVADLVHLVARKAVDAKQPVVKSVIAAMNVALGKDMPEVKEITRILVSFGVADITDHYVCGQFENIQNGLDGNKPNFIRPIPEILDEGLLGDDDGKRRQDRN